MALMKTLTIDGITYDLSMKNLLDGTPINSLQTPVTTATSKGQTVLGEYNILDTQGSNSTRGEYSFLIGNGTSNASRSNAFTVDWSGNVETAGYIEAENLPGIIKMFAGTFAPTGWLLCNGDEVLKTSYPALYDVIGDTYGTPSDNDHFVLPDLRGKMPLGTSSSHALATTGGSEYLQDHAHSGSYTRPTVSSSGSVSNGITGGSHGHPLKYNSTALGSGGTSRAVISASGSSTTSSNVATDTTHKHDLPNHTHTLTGGGYTVNGVQTTNHGSMTTGNAGNMPPFLTINYIISTGSISHWADSAGLPIVRDVAIGGQSIVHNEIANINVVNLSNNIIETSTTGTMLSCTAYQFGSIVTLSCQIHSNGNSIASGSNIYDGTITGIPLPHNTLSTSGYYGAHATAAYFRASGALTLRNASSTAVSISSSNNATVSFTYVVNT